MKPATYLRSNPWPSVHTVLCQFGLGLSVLTTAGCGSGLPAPPPLAAVEGTVTLDKQPLPGAVVLFEPENGRNSIGMTDDQGVYRLEFDAAHKGALIGKHKVRLTKRAREADLMAPGAAKGPPKPIPSRYNDKTTLEAVVKAGEKNKINFDLTSNL